MAKYAALNRSVRERREACMHTWSRRRSGVERCAGCGDQFPCKRRCYHVDCITRRLELKIIPTFPSDFPLSMMIMNGPRVTLDTTPDDPIDWVIPTKLGDVT